mgnify:CR=1 FL=1
MPAGLAAAARSLAGELEINWGQPPTWDALLEKPLVQSGWLGNLVPDDDQRAQLLSLYDADGNRQVDEAEFRAFLTRGLSRGQQLRVVQGRGAPPLLSSMSPWGPLDVNSDAELNESELRNAAAILQRYDFDGDRIVTQAEVASADDSMASRPMLGSTGFLESSKVLVLDAEKPGPSLSALLENYTFTETIARDAFPRWSPQRFDAVDTDGDGQIAKRELSRLKEQEPDAVLAFTFPDSLQEKSGPANAAPAGEETTSAWTANVAGGRLSLPGCIVAVRLRDDHSPRNRTYVQQLLNRAPEDAAVAAMLTSQLELKEGAIDLLRGRDGDTTSAAWRWLAAPRDWHLTATWTVAEAPWFELLDANGDGRIVESETAGFTTASLTWDRDGDRSVAASELPLVVLLSVARDDRRGLFALAGGPPSEKRGVNALPAPAWFSGMDYNSDGEITRTEFLGDDSDFSTLDWNGNGSIELREVTAPDR